MTPKSSDTQQTTGFEGTSPEKLWLVLARCYKSMADYARGSIEQNGLGLTDFAVLEILMHKGPLTISAIGAKVLLTSGSMTAAVDRLAERDLIVRNPGADRRMQQIALTRSGRKLIVSLFGHHQRALAEAEAVLTAEERTQLTQLLKKLGLFVRDLSQQDKNIGKAKRARSQKGAKT